ncbi:hypothetical protein QWY20_08800 [Alkalimonas sp. MEB108]|uniref:Lipoprotein n=1 Tax=Alkalimonas cellulosilytica TaxID=3058395 RepID=A0ABU7J4X7_9GAMM|nr:hypothetical protein [Alkalimonas sp. MEB108]MEE2001551.1 hypothetical protein [Alkalimonas sp. MEB108]
MMFIVIFLCITAACAESQSDFLHDDFLFGKVLPEVTVFNAYDQKPMLTQATLQKLGESIQGDETDIYVRLQNSAGVEVDSWIGQHPGNEPVTLTEAFYSHICQQELLVLVIHQRINTAISVGDSYLNALFDPVSGEWLKTLHGAKVKDKETDLWFVDSQQALLASLKNGTDLSCPLFANVNVDYSYEKGHIGISCGFERTASGDWQLIL